MILRYEPTKPREESINDYFRSVISREVIFDEKTEPNDSFCKKLFKPSVKVPNKRIARLVYICTSLSSIYFKFFVKNSI